MEGNGITYEDMRVGSPTVILNYPENYFNTTNTEINFNITATDNIKIANVTLYIDNILNREQKF